MLISDFEAINGHGGRWGLVVVDEAHTAKNSSSIFSRHLQSLDTESFVLLTGTIIHNNIEEELLHLLQSFVIPPVAREALGLQSASALLDKGLFIGGVGPVEKAIGRLLYCFMLRRLIQHTPGITMPPKIACTVYLSQTPLQKRLYAASACNKALCDKHPYLALALGDAPALGSSSSLTEADARFMRSAVAHSNKMRFLAHILPVLTAAGHRVLIFSNSLGALHLLGLCLTEQKHAIDLITGEMSDLEERKQRLDRFNAGRGPEIMLLSTKAMNQGVQLTGADTVIFYDHHDNPQNDNQAEARAYRITQGKAVLVLRLVTRGTKEEEAMGSWVKRKREVQEWLEFTQIGGASEDSRKKALVLDNEDILRNLLLNRRASGSWEGEWRASG